jgi:hypothetical protein
MTEKICFLNPLFKSSVRIGDRGENPRIKEKCKSINECWIYTQVIYLGNKRPDFFLSHMLFLCFKQGRWLHVTYVSD